MLLEALSALTLASAAQAEAPPQATASRPVADLILAMRGRCPPMVPKVQSASPDELLRLTTGFRDQLTALDRSKLNQARRSAGARCGAESPASCQANNELSAILHSDQMGAFVEYVCARETTTGVP